MKKAEKANTATIVLKRQPKADESLPKQSRMLLDVLRSKGGKLTVGELAVAARRKIKTKQRVEAVIYHYFKGWRKCGLVAAQ